MARPRWRRLRRRIGDHARRALLVLVFSLAVMGLLAFATVEYTAQPAFCATCHIMEPYVKSWEESSHSEVACIECHYEPGVLETVDGKFKALSQLAKYVTRTQGTKPWAEVSDASCMRSGCHSVRTLEGPIEFGRVKFDHRHHLLESRRGRRLRCVSCHSQIVQGEHVAVTEGVCFMCHFMPGPDGRIPEKTGDCLVCHGPPDEVLQVEGRPFDHQEFVGRGVACQECHDPVIEGGGAVRRERCHSCHGEIGHIERFGERDFLHEKHVTEHKVECFECHDEIRHGLLEPTHAAPTPDKDCGRCHAGPHEANRLLYSGTGAAGVEDRPSRMLHTRVGCESCHTGRSARVSDAGFTGHPGAAGGLAAAGPVDCIHCHGTGYDGMLEAWQAEVSDQLERLRPMLETLARHAPPNDPEVDRLLAEARGNLALVEQDGSLGAHNIAYAVDALRAGAQRMDRAFGLLGLPEEAGAEDGFPLRSPSNCTDSCHLGVERTETVPLAGGRFPHRRHLLAAGLDCSRCHLAEPHGRPAFPRTDCGSCHHQEGQGRDPSDCSACHQDQVSLSQGRVEGFEELPGVMAGLGCTDCHGEPPDILRPQPETCTLCHEEGYDEMLGEWQSQTDELLKELGAAIGPASGRVDPADLERARRALQAVLMDGSRGAHNPFFAEIILSEALGLLED